MQVFVNGETKDVPESTTLRGLIEHLGLGKALCAAEVNKKAVRRNEQESTTLKPGDVIEIVSLVGGG
jgi:thiamine biosynthesis protein ThiS